MSHLSAPARLSDHRILLVNDDGIHSPGLELLEEIVRGFTDDVWVVAPDEERSGASHSLSLTVPIRLRRIDDRHFAIKGTPTDCTVLAVWELMKDLRPTALLSGINRGANLADDITYSGTAAAAIEGTLLGIRSVALSQVFTPGGEPNWDTARRFGRPALERLLTCDWPPGSFVNVNFPNAAPDEVSGMRVTTQGQRLPGSYRPMKRIDGRNVPYYWIKASHCVGDVEAETDLAAVADKAVSITPLQLDMTAHSFKHYLSREFA